MKYFHGAVCAISTILILGMVGYMEVESNPVGWTHVIATVLLGIVAVMSFEAMAKEL